ncbi:MAG TPA: hypothetical protein VK060_08435 [Ruania sp.]|nr:hypothetical protein [Ruania sp.]
MDTGFGPSPDRQQPGSQQQFGHPGQPGYSAAAYQPGPATGSNSAGRVALAAGILVVLIGLVQQLVAYVMPALFSNFFDTYQVFALIVSGASVVIGLVAVIAGGIGLMAPGKPKGAAGAGCALGAWAVLGALIGLLGPAIMTGLT